MQGILLGAGDKASRPLQFSQRQQTSKEVQGNVICKSDRSVWGTAQAQINLTSTTTNSSHISHILERTILVLDTALSTLYIFSLEPYPIIVHIIIMPLLWIRKLRFKEVKWLIQDHSTVRWWVRIQTQICLTPEPEPATTQHTVDSSSSVTVTPPFSPFSMPMTATFFRDYVKSFLISPSAPQFAMFTIPQWTPKNTAQTPEPWPIWTCPCSRASAPASVYHTCFVHTFASGLGHG